MPTYTINGKRIKTDRELSEAEIDEIARDLAPVSGQAAIPTEGQPTAPAAVPTLSASERMFQNALAGAAAVPPMAAAARALQALTAGGRAAPYASNLAKALVPTSGRQLAAEGAIGAAGGIVGGELGQQVAQKVGEQYRPLGEFAGGAVGGLGANTLIRNVPETAAALLGGRATAPQQAADQLGRIRGASQIQQAYTSNPQLAPSLQEAFDIERQLGVSLPVLAAAKGDVTLENFARSITSRGENAPFTALLRQQEEEAKKQLAAARGRMAVSGDRAAQVAEAKAARVQAENARRERVAAEQQQALQTRIEDLDERIVDLSADAVRLDDGKGAIGQRITNLLNAKEQSIKKEMSPKYDDLLKGAKESGIEMPSTSVAVLHRFVKDSRADDVFNKFPELYSKINTLLAPSKAPVSGKFAEKYPNLVRSVEGTYKPIGVEDVDSLKRALNKALSQTKDADQARLLTALKRQVDGAIGTMDEGFANSYKQLDREYAERLGIPFSEEGVLSVDRARFVESVVPVLSNKPSAVRQILAATDNSPETQQVVRDAMILKLGNTAGIVKPDGIDVRGLTRFINQNKEIIDQVPGLRGELETIGRNVGELKNTRARLLEEQRNIAVEKLDNVWSRSQTAAGGFQGYVQRSLNNPEALRDLIATAGTDKSLQRGLKSALLDIGLNSSNKVQFFDDNAKTLNAVFGEAYSKDVKMLFDAAQRLQQFPLKGGINIGLTQKTGFEVLTGSRPEQIAGEIRNPVIGQVRAGLNSLSRFLQNRSAKAEQEEIMSFLQDRKSLTDAVKLIEEMQANSMRVTDKARNLILRLSKNTASAGLFGGLASVVPGELGLTERAPVMQFPEE